MNYKLVLKEQNDEMMERYELAMERISTIAEDNLVKAPYQAYFVKVAEFLKKIGQLVKLVDENAFDSYSMEELKKWNLSLYEDIVGENYEKSYANPAYAVQTLGDRYGKLLSFLYTEIRGMIGYAYEYRIFDLTITAELFLEIYNYFEDENEYTVKDVKNAIYYFFSDYSELTVNYRIRESLDPSLTFGTDIIMKSDLTDLRYLYSYGEYISENELEIAGYLNNLDESAIEAMAHTYSEGYRKGFEQAKIDLTKKKTVMIRYALGFERMVKAAILQFEKMGLTPLVMRPASSSINKNPNRKVGFVGTSPNKQYEYDHRYDDALFLDKAFAEKKLVQLKRAYEDYRDLAKGYAGPAVIETFGEKPFTPKNQPEANKLDEKQQKIAVNYARDAAIITDEFIRRSEYSFTIIAYPIPEIGDDFVEIFNETVKVNTLDYEMYQNIQQCIIDALDKGEYVHVLGRDKNKTDIKVKLFELKNPEKESIFENCLADVNIPVGEVFTSPVLTGTNGTLHVTKVYLNELEYKDLFLTFKDGKIEEYTCGNFDEEAANKSFVKENLMFNRDTLPLGEFAIGTNTTAYVMARKFNISDKLPILIAEKTGPHFAVGDTCYHMSEDNQIFNPDGKEIVAKENECSALRKTDIENAYFNCHTDITIPYDELGEISVYTKNGDKVVLIKDGRFVLLGTERLNDVFEDESGKR